MAKTFYKFTNCPSCGRHMQGRLICDFCHAVTNADLAVVARVPMPNLNRSLSPFMAILLAALIAVIGIGGAFCIRTSPQPVNKIQKVKTK